MVAVSIGLLSEFYGMFHVEHNYVNGFVMIDVPRGTYF